MTKQIILFFTIFLIGANLLTAYKMEETAKAASGPQVIPDEAIRLRILANSDSQKDQQLKRKVRDEVNDSITEWVGDLTSISEARNVIKGKLPEIEKIVERVLEEQGVSQGYSVKFGEVQFPTKLYGSYIYPAGTYEAILISIGEAEGANWWCVLFPPLCFLDFSNGEAVDPSKEKETDSNKQAKGNDDVEVKFFVVDIFTKIVDNVKSIFA